MMLAYAMAAAMGALVKIVDQIEDEFAGKSAWKFPAAILYGLLGGYLVSYTILSTLWIAVLFAQFFSGKVDRNSHMLGVSITLIFGTIFGIFSFNIWEMLLLFAAAFLDEWNPLKWPQHLRPALKLATIACGLLGNWAYFIAIMIFDAAYLLVGAVLVNPKKKRPS